MQFTDAFAWDTLLPRHLPGLWSGLGGYDFFFYGPLPFWITALVVSPFCAGCATETEIVIGAALFWAFSGLGAYWFLRSFFARLPSVLGAGSYMVLPYHLWINWFERQAFGEFSAYAFVPLIALGIANLRSNTGQGWILSFGVAGTILCHLPSALLAAHVFAAVVVIMAIQSFLAKENPAIFFGKVLFWAVLGALCASVYWLPALAMLDAVASDFLYSSHFIAERWLYSLSFTQPTPAFAIVLLKSFLVIAPFILWAAISARGELRIWIAAPAILVVVLNLTISQPIWAHWIIAKVQFPWRLMVFADLSAALAIAFCAAQLNRARRRKYLLAITLAALMPAMGVVQSAFQKISPGFQAALVHSSTGAREYIGMDTFEVLLARMQLQGDQMVSRGMVAEEIKEIAGEISDLPPSFTDLVISSRWIDLRPAGEIARVTVPILFWEFWTARNGEGIPLETAVNPQFGTLDVIAPEGGFDGSRIIIRLPYQPSEKIGFFLSLLSVLVTIVTAVALARRRQARPPS